MAVKMALPPAAIETTVALELLAPPTLQQRPGDARSVGS